MSYTYGLLKQGAGTAIRTANARSARIQQASPTVNTWYELVRFSGGAGYLGSLAGFVPAVSSQYRRTEARIRVDNGSWQTIDASVADVQISGALNSGPVKGMGAIVRFKNSLDIDVRLTVSARGQTLYATAHYSVEE